MLMKISLNKIHIFLLFFLIFFSFYLDLGVKINGVGTAYYSQLFFIIVSSSYLFFNIINRKFKIDYYFIFSLLILISIFLSLSTSLVNQSDINFIPVLSLIIFLLSFKYMNLVINNKAEFYYVINVIYLFLLIHLLYNFINIFDWIQINGFNYSTPISFLRPVGLASSPVESTVYIVLGYYVSELMNKKYIFQITKFLFLAMMFLSLSRLGILIGSIILFTKLLNIFFTRGENYKEQKLYAYVIIIILIIFIFLEYLYLYKGINTLFLDRFNDLFNTNLNSQRTVIYSGIIINAIYDIKLLFIGNGFQNINYNNQMGIHGITNNPHSTYLAIFSYQGLLGLLIFLNFLLYIVKESTNLINKKNFKDINKIIKPIISLQLIYILMNLFDTIYVSLGANIIFGILVSIPYTLNKLQITNK